MIDHGISHLGVRDLQLLQPGDSDQRADAVISNLGPAEHQPGQRLEAGQTRNPFVRQLRVGQIERLQGGQLGQDDRRLVGDRLIGELQFGELRHSREVHQGLVIERSPGHVEFGETGHRRQRSQRRCGHLGSVQVECAGVGQAVDQLEMLVGDFRTCQLQPHHLAAAGLEPRSRLPQCGNPRFTLGRHRHERPTTASAPTALLAPLFATFSPASFAALAAAALGRNDFGTTTRLRRPRHGRSGRHGSLLGGQFLLDRLHGIPFTLQRRSVLHQAGRHQPAGSPGKHHREPPTHRPGAKGRIASLDLSQGKSQRKHTGSQTENHQHRVVSSSNHSESRAARPRRSTEAIQPHLRCRVKHLLATPRRPVDTVSRTLHTMEMGERGQWYSSG